MTRRIGDCDGIETLGRSGDQSQVRKVDPTNRGLRRVQPDKFFNLSSFLRKVDPTNRGLRRMVSRPSTPALIRLRKVDPINRGLRQESVVGGITPSLDSERLTRPIGDCDLAQPRTGHSGFRCSERLTRLIGDCDEVSVGQGSTRLDCVSERLTRRIGDCDLTRKHGNAETRISPKG